MVDTIKVYVFKDPDTLEVRYVGITSKTLKQRFRKHLDNALYTKHNKHLCNWILKLRKENKKPIMEEIESCTIENWQEREKYWISQFNNLLNSTEGGEGCFGFHHSEESKKKISLLKKGLKQSDSTRSKRSNSLKGRIITNEHREKIGKANKGKIYTQYNIKVIDIINSLEHIFNNVFEVSKFLVCGKMTVYRYMRSKEIFKKQYKIVKI